MWNLNRSFASNIDFWSHIFIADEITEVDKGPATENNESENENDLWKQLKDLAGYIFFSS